MKKKARKTASVHSQVVPIVSSKLPCGACMNCLKSAAERAIDAVLNESPEGQAFYAHLVSVTNAVMENHGVLETLEILTNTIATQLNVSSGECLWNALHIMGFEKTQEAA